MNWVEPKYSKNYVRKAGEVLIDPVSTDNDKMNALDVLSNWRAVHAYPMHSILIFLRTKAAKIDKNAIVVQRLKRTPSIIRKLQRFGQMKLHRMQDIGGCRAVVSNVSQAERLATSIIGSRTRHILHKKDDYIQEPKMSGYRGIHLVYKYNGAKELYKSLFVEIQVRSKIQHSWATAVEIVDTFTNQALKASHGDKDWLNFFRYVSAEFAKMESRAIGDDLAEIDTRGETHELTNRLSVVDRLNAFAVSTRFISNKSANKSDYFILEIEERARRIKVIQFSQEQLKEATEKYLELEKKASNDEEYDVVLVSANTIHSLKKAYPNYFADSRDFLKNLSVVISSHNAIKPTR